MSVFVCNKCSRPYGCEVSDLAPIRYCAECPPSKCLYYNAFEGVKHLLDINNTAKCGKCGGYHGLSNS